MAGELILEETPHGLQVLYEGRRLYGRRPREDAARRIVARTFPADSLILWFSPVVWHGWNELRARLDGTSAVIAIEHDPVLREVSNRTRPDDPRVVLATGTANAVAAYRELGECRFRRVIEITTSAAAALHRDRYRTTVALVERENRVFWQNRMTVAALGRLWLGNLMRNLGNLSTGTAEPPVDNRPLFVCGAGPSLGAALPLLRRRRCDVAILAVDTALPILASAGVRPDAVVALEGQIANLADFLPVADRSYHLVADLTSHPVAVSLHRRRSWTLTRFLPISLLDRIAELPGITTILPPLGSVGVSAVTLALDLTNGPIICSGLDFAVLPGRTHARGAPAYVRAMALSTRLRPATDAAVGARTVAVPGYRGNVTTTLTLSGYADELCGVLVGRNDVYALDPFGLEIGARPIGEEACEALLDGFMHDPVGTAATRASRSRAVGTALDPSQAHEVLNSFMRNERDRLLAYDPRSADGALPGELDYLACEVPDQIETIGSRLRVRIPDPGTRARLSIARDYFLNRWNTALATLSSGT